MTDKIIRTPGKFEGEMRYVPHFWDIYLEGGADYDDEYGVLHFEKPGLGAEGLLYPELKDMEILFLYEDDNGFVHELTDYNPGAVEQGIYEYENDL